MKRKTVVITVVIAAVILVVGFVSLVVVVSMLGDTEVAFTGFGPKVAVVDLYGQIMSSQDFVRQMKKWGDDNSVKAIVIHIDSPGGAVAPSQEMYDEILKVRENGKTVIASISSVAASGGYYVASACDKIVANKGSLTGSIGVILSFPTAKKLLDKIGVQYEVVKSGELKDVGNFARPMSPEDELMLKAVIDDTYEQFVEDVAQGRSMSKEEIYPYADGSIFTGLQAYNFGLVDTLGTFEFAISMAGEMTDLGPNPDVVKEKKRQPSFLDLMSNGMDFIEKISAQQSGGPSLQYLYTN